jgi:hypothetical protein
VGGWVYGWVGGREEGRFSNYRGVDPVYALPIDVTQRLGLWREAPGGGRGREGGKEEGKEGASEKDREGVLK